MLFELSPSREVTGGAFYTEQDYDAEFVDVVKQQCLHFIIMKQVSAPTLLCIMSTQFSSSWFLMSCVVAVWGMLSLK